MLLKCLCGAETRSGFHKDNYELVRFICTTCKYKKHLISRATLEVRIVLSNGDFFYVKRAKQGVINGISRGRNR